MRPGTQKNDSDSSPGPSLDGSFRHPGSASVRSASSHSSKFVPTSKRVHKVLKEYSSKLIDPIIFVEHLEEWVRNYLHGKTPHFSFPFSLDDLHTFDYALEGVLFQQLLRMPCPPYASENLKEDEFLALEDFMHTAAEGLWHAFWHKNKPFPFFVSCPRYPGSKFYTVEKAISRGRLGTLSGAALLSKNTGHLHARWDDVMKFVLFKKSVIEGCGLSPVVVCEALFYCVHMLFSRSLSKYNTVTTDYVFVSVMDSKFGCVVKLGGDLGKLEVDLNNPYQSMAEWIFSHADISVSNVDRMWNKLGNVNWGDLGTLQILMATFCSIVQWNGPPRKSVESLAANHSLRLQKRRIEAQMSENENAIVPYQDREIVEVDYENENNLSYTKKGSGSGSRLTRLNPGEIVLLEDQNQCLTSFQVMEFLDDCSYIAVPVDESEKELTLYVGAHTSRLEPSWEDMNLWYQVQRQTKVLNMLKEQSMSVYSRNLPEMVASGRIVHPGPCEKKSPKGCCDHPWCGAPMLATRPVGEPVSSVLAREGPFSADEAARCCRDCLSALRAAKAAGILHGDIRPENVIRIAESRSVFVVVSWGRGVLEERDSPPLNLQFSSVYALQNGKLCPSSDVESLVYLVEYLCGGLMKRLDSIEAALKWRRRWWGKKVAQESLGGVSPLLKAFADYVDSICGTPYAVDYDVWVRKMDAAVDGAAERGKMVEEEGRAGDVAESSGGNSL